MTPSYSLLGKEIRIKETIMPRNKKETESTNRRILKRFKTKRRKTNAVDESAMYALDIVKPSQNDRKRMKRITNEE